MELPYKGRSIIEDNFTSFQIIIPTRKNWFIIIFLSVWLCGWCLGEIFAITTGLGILNGNAVAFPILIWLAGWTVAGIFAIRTFLWNLLGKEFITIGQGLLSVDKKAALFFKAKSYDLEEVKNIRVQEDVFVGGGSFLSGNRNIMGSMNTGGTIRFDYGFQTVKFAAGIDEAEAKFIIQKLKDRHILSDKNFS